MKISERRVKDIVVLDLNGKITAREGGPMLRERIRRLLRDGKKKILLNLAKVSSMDAVEAKEMLSSYFSVEKDGGQLRLCSPTRNVRELLERPSGSEALSAARHVVFMARVFEKEEEALSSFE